MCGIAGIHVFNLDSAPKWTKIENAIDDLYSAIDHRGGDATGMVAINDIGDVVWQKASCNAFEFYKERKNAPSGVRDILLHTRMATQGSAAFPENNHPVRRGSVYVVHNGHIWNDDEVFKKTSRERYGQVDSEAIAAVIAKYGILQTHKAMEEVAGAAAIGVIDDQKPGLMVLARGSSSPLMFYRNENIAVFASTRDAVKRAWRTLYGTSPKDNKIVDVAEGTALYLENDRVITERFTPDEYFSRPKVVTSYGDYSSYNGSGKSWSNGGYYGGAYTLDNAQYDAERDGWEDDYREPKVTFVTPKGEILCSHGIDTNDCEICNPDDMNGSYLPAVINSPVTGEPKIQDSDSKTWINAAQCELCDLWFAEHELHAVSDWEDDWKFCAACMDEMSLVINDVTSVKRYESIHDLPMGVEI